MLWLLASRAGHSEKIKILESIESIEVYLLSIISMQQDLNCICIVFSLILLIMIVLVSMGPHEGKCHST